MSLDDDLYAVRHHLGGANPVPKPALSPSQLAEGRASLGQRQHPPVPHLDFQTTPRRRRPRLMAAAVVTAVAAIAVAVVLALPANKHSSTASNGAKPVLAAYTITQRAATAHAAFSVTTRDVTVTGDGVGNLTNGQAKGVVTLPDPFGQLTFVSTGQVIYAKVPAGLRTFTGGKPWARLATANLAAVENQFLGDLGLKQPFDPTNVLGYLKSVSGNVTVVGHDTVRGAATTRYHGNVDLSKGAQNGQLIVPADLWIDGNGRLRKLVLSMTSPVAATATFELWDFGTTVDATPPPSSQVVDASTIFGGFGKRP